MPYVIFGLLSAQLGFDLIEFSLHGTITSNKAAKHHITLGQTERKILEINGRCQRGVHFGAVGLKRGEESSKVPIANFRFTFFYTIYKQFVTIMATQN